MPIYNQPQIPKEFQSPDQIKLNTRQNLISYQFEKEYGKQLREIFTGIANLKKTDAKTATQHEKSLMNKLIEIMGQPNTPKRADFENGLLNKVKIPPLRVFPPGKGDQEWKGVPMPQPQIKDYMTPNELKEFKRKSEIPKLT